jgi:hypothetical protein
MVLATSRMPRPFANKPAARRRLASNIFALPFGLIQTLLGVLPATLERAFRKMPPAVYSLIRGHNIPPGGPRLFRSLRSCLWKVRLGVPGMGGEEDGIF